MHKYETRIRDQKPHKNVGTVIRRIDIDWCLYYLLGGQMCESHDGPKRFNRIFFAVFRLEKECIGHSNHSEIWEALSETNYRNCANPADGTPMDEPDN